MRGKGIEGCSTRFHPGSQFGGLERDRPPGPLDASRQTSSIEFAQGFPQFAFRDLKPVNQVLDRAPRGHGGKTFVHDSPLPRLDIQSGGVGSWRHGAFLSGGAARRHVGIGPKERSPPQSGFADAPWNRNRPRISGRGPKPPNVLNDTSHPGGTGVDPTPGVPRLAYGPPSSSRKAVAIALARRLSLPPACDTHARRQARARAGTSGSSTRIASHTPASAGESGRPYFRAECSCGSGHENPAWRVAVRS
jgi:hypothetical protein